MAVRTSARTMLDQTMDWKTAESIRAEWGGEFCLKGVMSVEDTRRAVDIGATAIMVSNHGGRQLDGGRAPFDQLAEIVDAVGDRVDVICDGGIRRGNHVLKALSVGAKACSGGRMYLYVLAAAGQPGAERALELMRAEIERGMKLMGVRKVAISAGTICAGDEALQLVGRPNVGPGHNKQGNAMSNFRPAVLGACALILTLQAMPALAQSGARDPTTGERAKGIATQPLEDLNIHKDVIPAKLIAIQDKPYALDGIRTCSQINAEIGELNDVLGADVDASDEARRKTVDRVLDVGGGIIAGLMPFRGLVREVTGANAQDRRFQSAIFAGVTRRSYLKGMGKTKGCKLLAPVTVAQLEAKTKTETKTSKPDGPAGANPR